MDFELYEQHFTHLGPPNCGGHTASDRALLQTLVEVVSDTNAKRVLEIGFNQGGGALAFLMCGVEHVTSIDIIFNEPSVRHLIETFTDRFVFVQHDSQQLDDVLPEQDYDLAFIDGNHDSPFVENDVDTCIKLGIPYLLFDDTYHNGHPNIRRLVDEGAEAGRWTIVKEYPVGVGKTLVKVHQENKTRPH